jgi:hypothetical protein
MTFELTWQEAIKKVLSSSSTPLHYKDITERIISEGLRKSLGATPPATVNAEISKSIKHDKEQSPYIRVSKGTYTMRAGTRNVQIETPKLTPLVPESEETEEQYEIITSFGMFWRKDAVKWIQKPKLLGIQQLGATPVNFNEQLGIYLLYDGREVIYVGRTTDRPLGQRLFEHTKDRMSARWDRFSWFGLLPVSDEGKLGSLPETYNAAKLIPALEAILIEALEPRQNRKRGDDLSAVEFLQNIDPDVEKQKIFAMINNVVK